MNTGAFGENFPYTNFHELNMDWIIKIAKDFLNQYTHIQELISDGETALQNKTDSGLQQLQDKADNLETLLNEWYNTHSQYLAEQLASALNELNEWYTTHENYLDQTLVAKIAAFNIAAEEKAEDTLASIPVDYTTLAHDVDLLKIDDDLLIETYTGVNLSNNKNYGAGFIDYQTGQVTSHSTYYHTDYIPVIKGVIYGINGVQGQHFAMYDINKTYIPNSTNDVGQVLNTTTINNWWVFTANFDGYIRFTLSSSSQYSNFVASNSSDWFKTNAYYGIYQYSDSALIPLNVSVNRNLISMFTQVLSGTNACNYQYESGFIDYQTGEVVSHSAYYHTDYIRIVKGCMYGVAGTHPQHMAKYDINKCYIHSNSMNVSDVLKTRRENQWDVFVADFDGYIRLTVQSSNAICNVVIAESLSFFTLNAHNNRYNYAYPQIVPVTFRDKIYVYNTDGGAGLVSKMQYAFTRGHCDVIVEHGTYELTNDIVDALRSANLRGIPIGNDCHYYFNAATIVCNYTGSNTHDVADLFSPLDAQNIASDFEMYNLNLYAQNTCYALHDDAAGGDFCRHIYENCHIELNNTNVASADANILSKALGGGLAKYEEIIIKDCYFKAVNPYSVTDHMQDASFHDANNSEFTDAKLVITGCFFNSQFRASDLSTPSEPRPSIIFSNNSCQYRPDISGSWSKYEWNTVIR